ncbi:outer membrane protein assembly factor BamB [Mycobacterium frederiksbergense]|uniref:Outer membrane protein assembly factor BamB n=1 Tax=Mycolicibacterium frederiksbergense TaxID=117567 RepID=A0ABT6L1R0_9MYCO|nr:PQQ-binding-like beta-propeller repeat protein [Mycolicibacterium frederiksbergense]MDH6196874.1 outer membrane protein assembly factor BamB [Mycolicibacterium frederiksbergense]
MNQWGSSPWGDNDGQSAASGMTGSPFDAPGLQPGAPPTFGAAPGFPPSPALQGWGQQPYGGYPPQFTPQPPEDRRRRGKVIGIVVAAVVVVLALVVGVVVVLAGSKSEALSEADTAAGKAEIARDERPPAAVKLPSLGAAPGAPLWSYPPGGDDRGYLSVLGGDSATVLVSLNKSMIALDAATGAPRWQRPDMPGRCVVGTSGKVALCSTGRDNAVLLDMATGATMETMPAQAVVLIYSGAGLLAFLDHRNSLRVFDDAGRQLWTKQVPGQTSVFLDQGVVAEKERSGLSTKFYDAKTGNEFLSIGAVDDIIATSRGIAVSQRSGGTLPGGKPKQKIDFYSFTGKLAWRIPGDRGYRLPSTTDDSTGAFELFNVRTTSGVALPVVYSEGKGEIAAVDPLTGDIKWSQQVPVSSDTLVRLSGVANLCVVSYGTVGQKSGGVRVRDCNDPTGAFIAKSELDTLRATDGNQVVGRGDGTDNPVTAFDSATGQRSWQLDRSVVQDVAWVGDGLYSTWGGKISRLS